MDAPLLPVITDLPCSTCGANLRGQVPGSLCTSCGTPVPPQPIGPEPAPPGLLEDDRPCLQCGYNLKGLSTGGVCPECGSPVARSLQGNLLKFSAPDYLGLLHNGVFLVQTVIILQVLLTILGFVAVGALTSWAAAGAAGSRSALATYQLASNAIGILLSLLSLLGWWMLSAPDPAFVGTDDGTTARKVVRASVAARAVCLAIVALVGTANLQALLRGAPLSPQMAAAIGAWALAGVAWIVLYFAAMRYLRWLAPRLPNQRVHDRARLLTWLGPLLHVFGCGIGQLVGLVLYYNLLEWVRKDLKAIRKATA